MDYLDAVEKWKRQVEREGGQLLIQTHEEAAAALSTLTPNLSHIKVANFGIKNNLENTLFLIG
jgi:hypothetical protein